MNRLLIPTIALALTLPLVSASAGTTRLSFCQTKVSNHGLGRRLVVGIEHTEVGQGYENRRLVMHLLGRAGARSTTMIPFGLIGPDQGSIFPFTEKTEIASVAAEERGNVLTSSREFYFEASRDLLTTRYGRLKVNSRTDGKRDAFATYYYCTALEDTTYPRPATSR